MHKDETDSLPVDNSLWKWQTSASVHRECRKTLLITHPHVLTLKSEQTKNMKLYIVHHGLIFIYCSSMYASNQNSSTMLDFNTIYNIALSSYLEC